MEKEKVSDEFKKVVQTELDKRAADSHLFAVSYTKKNKNIDECINYILDTVKKSGINGFTDDEIFSMAMHYYDEDDITSPNAVKCNVIVNHTIKLTEEEIAEAKNKAIEKVISDQTNKMTKKPVATPVVSNKPEELTLF